MFEKLKKRLANRLLPYADVARIEPPKIETTRLKVETLMCEESISRRYAQGIPDRVYKEEIARKLSRELMPYMEISTNVNPWLDSIEIRAKIRVVKESTDER
jgi:hypothetical protein